MFGLGSRDLRPTASPRLSVAGPPGARRSRLGYCRWRALLYVAMLTGDLGHGSAIIEGAGLFVSSPAKITKTKENNYASSSHSSRLIPARFKILCKRSTLISPP